jgi:hypothetical protein
MMKGQGRIRNLLVYGKVPGLYLLRNARKTVTLLAAEIPTK